MGGSQRCVCGMFRGLGVSEGFRGFKRPQRPPETPRNPLGSPQSQGQGLRLDGQSQGMGGMSRCGKGGIPQGNPSTHHIVHSVRETSQHPRQVRVRRQKRGKGKNGGGRKKRKESYNPIMLPMQISRRKRWGDSPAFFVRNVRRAFLALALRRGNLGVSAIRGKCG